LPIKAVAGFIMPGININTIREYVGHEDERTTYHNYCFDRSSDEDEKSASGEGAEQVK